MVSSCHLITSCVCDCPLLQHNIFLSLCHIEIYDWLLCLSFFSVPQELVGMQYELGPKLRMSGILLQALHHVWVNYESSYGLYAAKLNKSHLVTGEFVSAIIT